MHLRASSFSTINFSTIKLISGMFASAGILLASALPSSASDLLLEGRRRLPASVLTGANSSAVPISADALLGSSAQPLRPVLGKRPFYTGPVPRAYPTASQRANWRAWNPEEQSAIATNRPTPSIRNPNRATSTAALPNLSNSPHSQSAPSNAPTDSNTIPPVQLPSPAQPDESTTVAQAIPSREAIELIQEELRGIQIPEQPVRRRTRRVYPGITISNPSGYGAERGQIFAGIGFQSRTRFSGGSNVGTIFGGGRRDGTAGIGFGFGDSRKSVGVQVSYTAASFGGSRAPLSGGLNAKVHKRFGDRWSAAIGGEGIINFGRLPEDNDEIEFNDFEGTYYGVITRTIDLRNDFSKPLSRLVLTGGVGTGRFRSVDQIANGEFAVGVFGSASLQVFPWANVITEWTGQDLAAGVSIAPFPNFPLVITPAVRDIVGEGDGDPRFVMGVGVSLSDIFSSLGL